MNRVTLRGLLAVLAAVSIISAVSASGAFAASPEFVLQPGGKFPVAFTAKWGTTKLVRANLGEETALQCETTAFVGSITAAKKVKGQFRMTGCVEPENPFLHNKAVGCRNTGEEKRHEVWSEEPLVTGELIYDNNTSGEMDILWNTSFTHEPKKADVMWFECAGHLEAEGVTGNFLTPLTAESGLVSSLGLTVGLTPSKYMSRTYIAENGIQYAAVLNDTDHWASGLAQAAIEVEGKAFTAKTAEPIEVRR